MLLYLRSIQLFSVLGSKLQNKDTNILKKKMKVFVFFCAISIGSIWIWAHLFYQPLSHTPASSQVTFTEIIVRSAFIDTRSLYGHKNCTVIFAEANKELRKNNLIEGCGVNAVESNIFKVVLLYFSWWRFCCLSVC